MDCGAIVPSIQKTISVAHKKLLMVFGLLYLIKDRNLSWTNTQKHKGKTLLWSKGIIKIPID